MPLNAKARDTIIEMVHRHGPEIVGDARRCEGYLRDFCAAQPLEMNLLIDALRERVPQTLQANIGNKLIQAHVPGLVQRLHLHRGMREDFAIWAIEAWAAALGIAIRAATTVPQTPAETQFRQAARFAIQDGVITRDERRNLDMLRDRLGLEFQLAQQIIAEAQAAAPPPAKGGTHWVSRVSWLIVGSIIIAGAGLGTLKALNAGQSGAPRILTTPANRAADLLASSTPTTSPGLSSSASASSPSLAVTDPVPVPALLIDATVSRLRKQINGDRNRVEQRLSELMDLERSTKQQRGKFDAALSELDRMHGLVTQAIGRAEIENRWPARVAGQKLSETQAREAASKLEKAVTDAKAAIAALDQAAEANQSLQTAGQTYRTRLNELKDKLLAARTEADLRPVADALTHAADAFAATERSSATAIRPSPPPPVTIDAVFSSIIPAPR